MRRSLPLVELAARRSGLLARAIASGALLLGACKELSRPLSEDQQPLARVEGLTVSRGLFQAFLHDNFAPTLDGSSTGPAEVDDSVHSRLLDSLLTEQLLKARALQAQIEVSAEERDRFLAALGLPPAQQLNAGAPFTDRQWLQQYLDDCLLVKKFLDERLLADVTVGDAEAREAYARSPELFATPTRYRLRRLQADTPEDARVLTRQLKRDGSNFDEVVALLNSQPEGLEEEHVDEQGRDLGYWTVAMLPEAFAEAIAPLAAGQVSDPVDDAEGGTNVFLVSERIEGRQPAFEEVADLVKSRLRRERAATRLAEYIASERARAAIEIVHENLGFIYVEPASDDLQALGNPASGGPS